MNRSIELKGGRRYGSTTRQLAVLEDNPRLCIAVLDEQRRIEVIGISRKSNLYFKGIEKQIRVGIFQTQCPESEVVEDIL